MTHGARPLGSLILLLFLACRPSAPTRDGAVPAASPGGLAEQLAALEQRIVADPANAALYAERARLYTAADSLRQAFKDWERAIAADSTNATYRMERGDLRREGAGAARQNERQQQRCQGGAPEH